MDHKEEITKLGNSLVQCSYQCEGVVNEPEKGIIPRCLIYEERKKNAPGSIVVGINPGKCSESERQYYIDNGKTYKSFIDFWDQKVKNLAYYKKSRELITMLGFEGDILWTDLAKCECRGENGNVPVQTLRVCIDRFLEKEIKILPDNFTIIALGNIAFDFCALRFPNRFVIGLPHPTGAYGTFKRLKDNILENKEKYLADIAKRKDDYNYYRAIKIFS
jgi:hypothetical protein